MNRVEGRGVLQVLGAERDVADHRGLPDFVVCAHMTAPLAD
jgi:hypothetical protein